MKTFWFNQRRSAALKPFPWINMFGRQHFREASRTLELHRNTGIEIHFVHKGVYRWEVEGAPYEVRPGDAFLTRPWEIHGGQEGVKHKGVLAWIIIEPKAFTTTGKLRLGPWSGLSPKEQGDLGRIFTQKKSHHLRGLDLGPILQEIFLEITERETAFKSRVHSLIDELLVHVARRMDSEAGRNPEPDFLGNLSRFLNRDLSADFRVKDLADRFGLGVPAFTSAVRHATGLSPRAWWNQLRIQEAIRKIAAKVPLSEVAASCGFSSQQHFGNVFKVITGFTPGEHSARAWSRGKTRKGNFPVHGTPGARRPRLR